MSTTKAGNGPGAPKDSNDDWSWDIDGKANTECKHLEDVTTMEEDKLGKCKSHRYNNDNTKRGKIDGGFTLNTDKNQIKEGETTATMMKE
eukprot:14326435-Ditylum_brightwellii.AAC.2